MIVSKTALRQIPSTLLILCKSIWLFPSIVTLVLLILTSLQISGSSIGIYHIFFYGDKLDSNLLVNEPQSIRSDEFLVNTQKALAQQSNDFQKINNNLGNGEDTSLLADIPSKDWSTIFRPHNIPFLFLPFDNAFALKWWAMSYLLVLSVYFFALLLLPGRRLIATLLALGFLFSPFIQWWYTYGALGSIYLSLFATIAFSRLIAAKRIRSVLAWSIAFAYSAICFIIILYPPFQIPAAIIGLCLCAGLFFEQKKNINTKMLKRNVLALGASIATVLLIAGVFLVDKMDIISSVSNTAYPGERLIQSGGYSKEHFLTSNLAPLFQDKNISEIYDRPGGSTNAVNQSESSNFILIFYFLIPLLLLFSVRAKTWTLRLKLSPMTIALLSATVLFTVWMFLPGFDFIGKATLLSQVPQARLLIGFGILNLLFIILYIRETSSSKKIISPLVSIIISLLIFIFYLLLNFHTMLVFEGFLTFSMAVFLALPIPAAIFFFLRKRYSIALTILLVFTFLSSFQVHPLYRGTEVITESELSKSMRDISGDSKRKWIVEDVRIENFAAANGLRSLSGSYLYPQMNLWKELGQDSDLYNRYSHTVFVIDRDTSKNIRPAITVPQADRVDVAIEACDRFLKQNDVGFIVTSSELQQDPLNPCYKFEKKIRYPEVSYYIYRIID